MTIDKSQRTIKLGDNDWRNMLITEMKRTGGDPSFFFEILEDVVRDRAWETLLDTDGKPVGSLRRFIEAPAPVGCGQKVEKVLRLLEIEHRYEQDKKTWQQRMQKLREDVHQELGMSIQSVLVTLQQEIADKSQSFKNIGTVRDYRINLLNQAAPDIAQKVISKDISDAEGMRQLRKRQGITEEKRPAVSASNAESAYNTLTKNFPTEVLDELILLLVEWKEKNG